MDEAKAPTTIARKYMKRNNTTKEKSMDKSMEKSKKNKPANKRALKKDQKIVENEVR